MMRACVSEEKVLSECAVLWSVNKDLEVKEESRDVQLLDLRTGRNATRS